MIQGVNHVVFHDDYLVMLAYKCTVIISAFQNSFHFVQGKNNKRNKSVSFSLHYAYFKNKITMNSESMKIKY